VSPIGVVPGLRAENRSAVLVSLTTFNPSKTHRRVADLCFESTPFGV
jgi:hypothetical protein